MRWVGPLLASVLVLLGLPDSAPAALSLRQAVDADLTIRLQGQIADLQESSVRLAIVPDGRKAAGARVLLNGTDATGDGLVEVGPPFTVRGVQFVPVIQHPADPGKGLGPVEIEVVLDTEPDDASKLLGQSRARRFSRGFYRPLARLLDEEQLAALESDLPGSYLIISAPQYQAAVEPLAQWKREKGYVTELVTTDQAGGSVAQIREFVSDRYRNADVPPQFVLLVGDVDVMPVGTFDGSVTDHYISMIDGDDFLPDLSVGRLSGTGLVDIQTFVAKILRHEMDPYREEGGEWFRRGLMVAANYASTTPIATSRWCRLQLLDTGFSQVDTLFHPPLPYSNGHFFINPKVNAGVSIIGYRGWARGHQGWEPPIYVREHVMALENGWKLPVVMSFVCRNNDFGHREQCFGEIWTNAGSPDAPKGAVAFLGNSHPWSHTRFNDAQAFGTFNAIREGRARTLGQLMDAGKYENLVQFPAQLYYEDFRSAAVEFYYFIYNLLGDPEMELWLAEPVDIAVGHPASIYIGTDLVEVSVEDFATQGPVEGARVGISQGRSVLALGFTDAHGMARIPISILSGDQPVKVTVTGAGVQPYQESIPVSQSASAMLAVSGMLIVDSGEGESRGNGDGIPNPGETIELHPVLYNHGAEASAPIPAGLSADTGIDIVTGTANYPAIRPGDEAHPDEPFVITLDRDLADGRQLLLRIAGLGPRDAHPVLNVHAPALVYDGHTLDGDGHLMPGGRSLLSVSVRNGGNQASGNVVAVLRSLLPDLAVVTDSTADLAPIPAGERGECTREFEVQVLDGLAIGQAVPFMLTLTAPNGRVEMTSFSMLVGEVDYRAPIGPDAYGYYAYDNCDTDYPDSAPVYDWVTASTAYGGSGTRLSLRDQDLVLVDLPFTFTYYGRDYDQILVSDNGWISFDTTPYYDWFNWSMPSAYGNAARIAPFWDNLNPQYRIDGELVGDGIYILHDAESHRFVVEWSRLVNHRYEPNQNEEGLEDLQTFQVLLFDPAYKRSATTGDGVFQFQYKQVVNNDAERMFATVGIEDHTKTMGLEHTYINLYHPAAAPLSPGLAIRFTTEPPVYRPFSLSGFSARPTNDGLMLHWEPADSRPRGAWRVFRVESGRGDTAPVLLAELPAGARSFLDEGAHSGDDVSYLLGSYDPFGHETVLGPYSPVAEEQPGSSLMLAARGGNPFRNGAELVLTLPERAQVRLLVYDVTGRVVRVLEDREMAAGTHSAQWDGRDDLGRMRSSGIYLARLETGAETRTVKLTLLR